MISPASTAQSLSCTHVSSAGMLRYNPGQKTKLDGFEKILTYFNRFHSLFYVDNFRWVWYVPVYVLADDAGAGGDKLKNRKGKWELLHEIGQK